MYFNDHNPPHCHAKYSGYEAIFDFEENVLEGDLPPLATVFVQEWVNLHKLELTQTGTRRVLAKHSIS